MDGAGVTYGTITTGKRETYTGLPYDQRVTIIHQVVGDWAGSATKSTFDFIEGKHLTKFIPRRDGEEVGRIYVYEAGRDDYITRGWRGAGPNEEPSYAANEDTLRSMFGKLVQDVQGALSKATAEHEGNAQPTGPDGAPLTYYDVGHPDVMGASAPGTFWQMTRLSQPLQGASDETNYASHVASSLPPIPIAPAGRPGREDYDLAYKEMEAGRKFADVFAEWSLTEHAKDLIDPRKSLKNAFAARRGKKR
jgi:hypothetical protein